MNRPLRIITINVNNGSFVCESILILTPGGKVMLIDGAFPGGTFRHGDTTFQYGVNVIPQFLKRLGIRAIDYIMISHLHDDHIGEIPRMILSGDFEVGELLWSPVPNRRILEEEPECGQGSVQLIEALKSSCAIKNIPMKSVVEEPLYLGDGVLIDILAVSKPNQAVPNYVNNNSIVMKLAYGDFSMLFTGDAGWEEEKRIMDTGRGLTSDVLKIAHHGGKNSTSQAWLKAVSARVGIASMPKWLSEDPRGLETYALLKSNGLSLYRTWEHGDIEVRTDGARYHIVTSNNGSGEVGANDAERDSGAGSGLAMG